MAYPWNEQNPPPTFGDGEDFLSKAQMIEIVSAITALHEGASATTPTPQVSATKDNPQRIEVATGVYWWKAFHFATDGSTLPAIWYKQGNANGPTGGTPITTPDLVEPLLPPNAA